MWQAVLSGPYETVPVAAALLALLLLVVAVRSLRSAGRASIDDDGVAHIVSGDAHHRFALTNPATEVEVVGEPGERGWQVVFHRRALPPVTVDAAMVEPGAFTEQLRAWRPEA